MDLMILIWHRLQWFMYCDWILKSYTGRFNPYEEFKSCCVLTWKKSICVSFFTFSWKKIVFLKVREDFIHQMKCKIGPVTGFLPITDRHKTVKVSPLSKTNTVWIIFDLLNLMTQKCFTCKSKFHNKLFTV